MEAIAFVFGLAVVGVLALRFGQDSREGMRCKEQDLAVRGMTWADLAPDGGADASASPRTRQPYPTVAFIEQALGAAGVLSANADAERLEARARELATEYWSDVAWTTGVVPETAFRRVLAALAPALADAPVRVVEAPIAVAESTSHVSATLGREQSTAAPERAPSFGLAGSSATV